MTRAEFDELLRGIDARFAGRPAALERETAAWMAAGLAGFLAWVGTLAVAGLVAFAVGVVLPFEAGVWLLIGGVVLLLVALSQGFLFFSFEHPPPEGHALREGEAPNLRAMLESLGRELECRPFDDIRITMEFNAGIREVPRLGFLGWPRSLLSIGLPMMEALTADELRAVLAHEMAHTSARHGRSGSRIYRLNRTWTVLFHRMQRPTTGSFDRALRSTASRFAGWYWPRLQARALVLSRAHEYHADRVSAGCAGAPVSVSALWKAECWQPMLSDRFWPAIFREADQSSDPPADLFDRMRQAFRTPPAESDAARWMDQAIGRTTGHDETHPSLPDRARALGLAIDDLRRLGFPTAPEPSAAETLLGPDLPAIAEELTSEWRKGTIAGWHQRHRRAMAEARRRGKSEAPEANDGAASAARDVAGIWEAARTSYERLGPEAAEPLLRDVLECDPSHEGATVVLGAHLLKNGDPEGLRMLERIAGEANEASWMREACRLLHDHFRATGQPEELRRIRSRLDRLDAEAADAQRERANVHASDRFLPHGLMPEELSPMIEVLASHKDCGAAWLVRKDLKFQTHRPLFVLCVRRQGARWWGGADLDRELVRRLIPTVQLPGQVLIVGGYGIFKALAKRVQTTPGAEVYRRDHGCRMSQESRSGFPA